MVPTKRVRYKNELMARICIATLDPAMGGGVSRLSRFLYETAEKAGHDPFLAFNRVNVEDDIRLQDVLREGMTVEPSGTVIDGMEAKYAPRVLPEFEFFHYTLNGDAWSEILEGADLYFGVGGNNQCCHPLSLRNQPFGCWIASPFWADRKERIENATWLRRIRDYLSKPVLESIEDRIYEDASFVYTTSEYTAETIIADNSLDQEDVEVVPYPIDVQKFSPESDRGTDTDPQLLFVGRLNDPRKNTQMLLKSFKWIEANYEAATLKLVGEQPNAELSTLVDHLGIQDSVEFVGHVSDKELARLYRESAVFVIPSFQEGLGIVGLEAMASGTPVVATKCGGPEDYVIDGENGYIVPVDDPAILAKHILDLLENDSKRRAFGERARELMKEEYAIEVVENKFIQGFERLEGESSKNALD